MRRILLLCAALVSGCVPAPAVTPHLTPIPVLGLNGSFGGALDPSILAHLNGLGPLTLRATIRAVDQGAAVLASLEPYPNLSALLLVESDDLHLVAGVASLPKTPKLIAVELGNELDLAGKSPDEFYQFVSSGHTLLRASGFTGDVISGGIYTVTNETLEYLKNAAHWSPDIVLGVHWYGDSSDEWLGKVQALAAGRRVAVTEFGLPSRTADEDRAQLAYLTEQLTAFRRLGASYALVYQLVSGATSSNLDNFGLQRMDGSWKPAEVVLKTTP